MEEQADKPEQINDERRDAEQSEDKAMKRTLRALKQHSGGDDEASAAFMATIKHFSGLLLAHKPGETKLSGVAPDPLQLQAACLGERADGTMFGCGTNWDPDFAALARAPGLGPWSKVFRFVELRGPVSCPAGPRAGAGP